MAGNRSKAPRKCRIISIDIVKNLAGCSAKTIVEAVGGTGIGIENQSCQPGPPSFEDIAAAIAAAGIDNDMLQTAKILLVERCHGGFEERRLIERKCDDRYSS